MTTVLVASSGGHLTELVELRPRFGALADDVRWITFDTPQTRAVLAGEDVVFARYTPPRDYRSVAANAWRARQLLPPGTDAVISTGSGIALAFLPLARSRGIPAHYIESATRTDGPSVTGRVLQHTPGVRLYAQCSGWSGGRWPYGGSVLDRFEPAAGRTDAAVRRVVVTLGAMPYPFRRLLERLVWILPADAEVLWQTGVTPTDGLPIDARPYVPADELEAAMAEADVVVAHAGCGSVLCTLAVCKLPVLVPRLHALGENIDDHQVRFGAEVAERGLAITRPVERLTLADLEHAARLQARERVAPAFLLALAEAEAG